MNKLDRDYMGFSLVAMKEGGEAKKMEGSREGRKDGKTGERGSRWRGNRGREGRKDGLESTV